jgi:hypothetical protein
VALANRQRRLVTDGPPPGGDAMNERFDPVVGAPAPRAAAGGAITQTEQRPLQLVVLGSLN